MAKKVTEFAKSNYGIGITGELGNSLKEENKVYYSIYNLSKNQVTENTILVEPENREKMKSYVANKVLEDLWNILIKN